MRYLALAFAVIRTCTAASPCVALPEILPGGDPVETRFIAAPVARVHEVISDAMQAAGVFLFKNTQESLEGERTAERVGVLRLPRGDELIRALLTPSVQEGKAGTSVRMETLRRGNKQGTPKSAWSAAVLDQAACLVGESGAR